MISTGQSTKLADSDADFDKVAVHFSTRRRDVDPAATSTDGLHFTRVDDVTVGGRRRWLGNVVSAGSVMTFFGTGDPEPPPITPAPGSGPRGGVWMATSRDGREWQVSGSVFVPGADPGAVASKDGGWIAVVTGRPRGREPRGIAIH